jgi:hypothetical protein
MIMPSKKQAPIQRNFKVQYVFSEDALRSMLQALLYDLASLRSRDRRAGVGTSHPLVVVLKKLSEQCDLEADMLIDDLKVTNEDFAFLVSLFPENVDTEFMDQMANAETGDLDGFPWHVWPPADRAVFVDKLSAVVLGQLNKILQEELEERKKQMERDKEREKQRSMSVIDNAMAVLRNAGYTVNLPLKVPKKKTAK